MILQTLKKAPIFLFAGTILMLSSCNDSASENVEAENSASENATTEVTNETQRSAPNLDNSEKQPLEMEVQNTNPSNDVVGKVNPPHGEPGHDCAIAVGAPLSPTPKLVSPDLNNNQNNQSANLNPPHGEPGHDCAVAVGAPLN